jgi:hypothetical protein
VAAKGDLFSQKVAWEKQEKTLTQQVAALNKELLDARALSDTARSSAQHLRLQLEVSKVRSCSAALPIRAHRVSPIHFGLPCSLVCRTYC